MSVSPNESCLETKSARTFLGTDAIWGSLSYQVKPGKAVRDKDQNKKEERVDVTSLWPSDFHQMNAVM